MTRRDLRVTIATTLNIRGWGQQPSCQPHRLPHRRMSTQHALLISLIEKPSSGYDLARRFDKSIGYFWHATHQQIYRELGRMAELGWIAAAENAGAAAAGQGDGVEKKNRKKVYEVLPAGRDELVRWVLSPSAGLDQREEILVKLRADAAIGPLGLDREMTRLIALHEDRLALYREIERREFFPASWTAGSKSSTRCCSGASVSRRIGPPGDARCSRCCRCQRRTAAVETGAGPARAISL